MICLTQYFVHSRKIYFEVNFIKIDKRPYLSAHSFILQPIFFPQHVPTISGTECEFTLHAGEAQRNINMPLEHEVSDLCPVNSN